jgi:hypothetical protein
MRQLLVVRYVDGSTYVVSPVVLSLKVRRDRDSLPIEEVMTAHCQYTFGGALDVICERSAFSWVLHLRQAIRTLSHQNRILRDLQSQMPTC